MVLLENIIIKNKIKKFINEVDEYNSKYDLKTFDDFIFHGYNGMCGSTLGILTTAPKLLLVASKSFWKYYAGLDIDFAKDFFEQKGMYSYSYYFGLLNENKTVSKYIKKYLKDDFKGGI